MLCNFYSPKQKTTYSTRIYKNIAHIKDSLPWAYIFWDLLNDHQGWTTTTKINLKFPMKFLFGIVKIQILAESSLLCQNKMCLLKQCPASLCLLRLYCECSNNEWESYFSKNIPQWILLRCIAHVFVPFKWKTKWFLPPQQKFECMAINLFPLWTVSHAFKWQHSKVQFNLGNHQKCHLPFKRPVESAKLG